MDLIPLTPNFQLDYLLDYYLLFLRVFTWELLSWILIISGLPLQDYYNYTDLRIALALLCEVPYHTVLCWMVTLGLTTFLLQWLGTTRFGSLPRRNVNIFLAMHDWDIFLGDVINKT